MPRPKSDLVRHMFMVAPATLASLDAIAAHHGWLTDRGEPNRSRAVRELATREAKRIGKRPKA